MRTFNFEIEDDESNDEIQKYSFGQNIAPENHYYRTPLFCYNFIDTSKTNYHFSQIELDNHDIVHYFKKLKQFSFSRIDDLLDQSTHTEHFHIYTRPNRAIQTLLEKLAGRTLRKEELPCIGQFGLYTHKDGANRTEKRKSPRIYFIVGAWGIFHILFYDPFHEINPNMGKA